MNGHEVTHNNIKYYIIEVGLKKGKAIPVQALRVPGG
jgi:hypothetical protein